MNADSCRIFLREYSSRCLCQKSDNKNALVNMQQQPALPAVVSTGAALGPQPESLTNFATSPRRKFCGGTERRGVRAARTLPEPLAASPRLLAAPVLRARGVAPLTRSRRFPADGPADIGGAEMSTRDRLEVLPVARVPRPDREGAAHEAEVSAPRQRLRDLREPVSFPERSHGCRYCHRNSPRADEVKQTAPVQRQSRESLIIRRDVQFLHRNVVREQLCVFDRAMSEHDDGGAPRLRVRLKRLRVARGVLSAKSAEVPQRP